jgi:trehalose synthase
VAAPEDLDALRQAAARLRHVLPGSRVWNVNSTAAGGGVAEMLRSLLAYARDAGVEARWLVTFGDAEFFRVTKRLHNALHGAVGDGSALDETADIAYRRVTAENARQMLEQVPAGDVVVLHDPQTAGMIPALTAAGRRVIWRCHIGGALSDPEVRAGWAFLAPYLEDADAFVFSRDDYIPRVCRGGRTLVVHPSIDPFSAKNQMMSPETVRAILVRAGLSSGPNGGARPVFLRESGEQDEVRRQALMVQDGPPPAPDTPLIVQVSRWDRLKDPVGVLEGFWRLVSAGDGNGCELMLVGPFSEGVTDDPEGAQVYEEVVAAWRALPPAVRRRVRLASIPMDDLEENAAVVNALQRHAAVVVQKSLQEGFGLTVTEAMWKGRPVVASAVGGIRDQIEDGVHGLLLGDPRDLDGFAAALRRLLDHPDLARTMGREARQRVQRCFLGTRALRQYADLIGAILSS